MVQKKSSYVNTTTVEGGSNIFDDKKLDEGHINYSINNNSRCPPHNDKFRKYNNKPRNLSTAAISHVVLKDIMPKSVIY